jgi:hypothetical protein
MVRSKENNQVIKLKNSSDINIDNVAYYDDEWDNAPAELPRIVQ